MIGQWDMISEGLENQGEVFKDTRSNAFYMHYCIDASLQLYEVSSIITILILQMRKQGN